MPRQRLVSIFALAFIVRLIFAVQWHALPYGPDPLLDAKLYHEWAQSIAAGHIGHSRAFYMMPLYPYVLGLFYAVFGSSLWVATLFNVLLNSATCVVLAELTFLAFGEYAAIATGILAGLYRPLIFYTPQVMKESLGIFLLALFALLVFRALAAKDRKLFFWSGVCLGLATLVRGNVLALAIVPLALFYLRAKKPLRVKPGLIFVAGIAVAILPVTLHNAIASHDFVLTSYAGGFNAYVGHGPMATGRSYEFPLDISSNPGTEETNAMRLAAEAEGHPLKPSEISAYWRDKAIDYAFANPRHEWDLLVNKFEAFWSNDEPYDNYDMDFIKRHFDTLISWPLIDFGIISALALFAVIALTGKRRKEISFFAAMTGVYMLTLILFYVTDRYRLSAVVFLLPLAGAAVPAAMEGWRAKKKHRLAVASIAALVPIALTFVPQEVSANTEAFDWGTLCGVYEDNGEHISTIIALNQALTIEPHVVGADAWIKSADALTNRGHRKEAEQTLRTMETVYPADGTVPYNLGRMAFIDEDYPTALKEFQKAIERSPSFGLAYRGVAAVYDHYGDHAQALAAIRHGLEEDPDDPVLLEVKEGFGE